MNCVEIITKYIKDDMTHAIYTAKTFINEGLNKHYYPTLTTDDYDYLMNAYIAYTVLHYKYYSDDDVRAECRKLEKQIEEYCGEHYQLNILDSESLFQNIIRYLCDLFTNIV